MTKHDLRRAAWLLRLWAQAIRANAVPGEWADDDSAIRAEHDEHMDLSRKLYAAARAMGPKRGLI